MAGRVAQAALVIGIAAAALYVALRYLPELFIDTPTVRRAMDDEPTVDEPPVLRNELPPPREAGLGPPARTAPSAWLVPGAGVVRGRVAWQRVRPPPVIPFLVSDPLCGVTVNVPRFVTGELGGVAEALVVVIPRDVAAPPAPPREQPLVANVRACLPRPRLLAGPPGTPVVLGALGSARHEIVPSVPLPGLPATLTQGGKIETRLPAEGTAFLTDPAHPWERITLIAVPSTLWSTVNAEGFFRVDGVPPGPATVRIYTEGTGPFDREVVVAPGGETMLFVDVADETPGFARSSP